MGSIDNNSSTADFTDYIGLKPTDEIGQAVLDRAEEWSKVSSGNGLLNQWRQNFRMAYNVSPQGLSTTAWDALSVSGMNGESITFRINHYRNVAQNALNVIYGKIFGTKVLARNSNPDSLEAVKLGQGLIDWTMETKRVFRQEVKAGEYAWHFGTGFIFAIWDHFAGKPIAADESTGEIASSGDLYIRAKSPFDIYFDQSVEDWEDVEWIIVRDFKNKYALAEQFPDLSEKILRLNTKDRWDRSLYLFSDFSSDQVAVFHLFVKPKPQSKMLAQGRYAMVLDDDLVVYDGPNPYDRLPVFLVRPQEGLGTVYGYTPANDVAPVQQMYNVVASTIATNVAAHGVSSIYSPRGSGISATQLSSGMQLLEGDPAMNAPEVLNFLATPPELYQFEHRLEEIIETLSGVNSVARGQPDEQLKSGRALAIVQSAMVQFISGFFRAASEAHQDLSNHIIDLYRKFSSGEQEIAILGKDQAVETMKWQSSSLDPIYTVRCEQSDPAANTYGGKLDKAEALLGAKTADGKSMLSSPQEYLTLVETGQMEPMLAADEAGLSRIRKENSMISRGILPVALVTDSHALDINEHMVIASDPEMRLVAQGDPNSIQAKILGACLNHVAAHQAFMQGQIPGAAAQLLHPGVAAPSRPPLPPGPPQQGPPPGSPHAQPPAPPPGPQQGPPQ